MPAICMRFRQVVTSGLSANTIRFATATSFGHRVKIEVSKTYLNTIFQWRRSANTSLPLAELIPEDLTAVTPSETGGKYLLKKLIKDSITASGFDDLDKKTNGLDFSSSVLTRLQGAPTSAAVREVASSTATMNDLVMAYVLFRCFGKSEYSGAGEIYNIDDAYNMVTNDQVVDAIGEKFYNNPEEVQNFLREQLTKDPARYLTSTAPTIAALFDPNSATGETADTVGQMEWLTDDVIEIPVRLVFTAPVSVASISDDNLYATGADQTANVIEGEASTWTAAVAPKAGNVLAFRLQLTVV